MSNKPIARLGTSPAIQDIIEKQISNCAKRIRYGSDAGEEVKECVSNILFELEDANLTVIQDIIKKQISDSAHQIETGLNALRWVFDRVEEWVFDRVEECVFNILFRLEDANLKVWELASVQRNYYFDKEKRYKNYHPNELDWEEVKESEFRKVKIEILDKIIERKPNSKKELQPIELFALESNVDAKDIPADTRYNLYVDYLPKKIWSLINDLKAETYKYGHDTVMRRQRKIEKLYQLMNDERRIIMLDENKAWEIVNQAWGLDCGL